jgi:hypothetical protein
MVEQLLDANGIPSMHTPPLAPVLGLGTGGVTVRVRASDLEQARALLP